jgi:hypothetical protein
VVAVVYTVPLLCEALSGVLDEIAELRTFPARGDTPGLLRSLRPDAVVVDSTREADAAEAYAREARVPLVHVVLKARRLRLYRDGVWHDSDGGTATPEGIRNYLIAGIFGREEVA